MDSLYGGHQGNSFVLKAAFKSYADMVRAFKQGPDYKDVWYNEYCLLDTPNKNDKDNGKIYQRGLNYQDQKTGGAIYLGQIVGPSSGTPYMALDTLDYAKAESTRPLDEYEYRRFPVGKDDQDKFITSDGSDGKPLAYFDFENNHSLLPGKYQENGETKYRDSIKYTWVNIRKDNADADSWFYVGMQYVYPVTDFVTEQVSPYDPQGNISQNAATATRTDDESHPYYAEWTLGIPKGIKGDALRNLRVIVPTNADKGKIYQYSALQVNDKTGEVTLGEAGYPDLDNDIRDRRQIVVFDYLRFDKKQNPEPIYIYLGDWNVIESINVNDEGTLTINYTNSQIKGDNGEHLPAEFKHKIKWIKSASLTTGAGKNGGTFTIEYNNKTEPYVAHLTWLKDIKIDRKTGDVTYTYCGTGVDGVDSNSGQIKEEKVFKWVDTDPTKTYLNPDNGHFQMTYIGDPLNPLVRDLTWVKDIKFDESNGDIKLYHTTDKNNPLAKPDSEGQYCVLSDAKLKILVKAEASKDGIITFTFNTGDKIDLKSNEPGIDAPFKIKTVEDLVLNNDSLVGDQHLKIKYNTESKYQNASKKPINYLERTTVRPSDYHLFMLFSDPTHRVNAEDLNEDGMDKNNIHWISNKEVAQFAPADAIYNGDGENKTAVEGLYWRDYGTIKDQHGILVGLNVTYEQAQADGGILPYLTKNYPFGLTGADNALNGPATKGKIVTYDPKPSSAEGLHDKEFYAFDYNAYQWFYLGKISDTGSRDVALFNRTDVNAEKLKTLNTKGILFTKSVVEVSDADIPSFWAKDHQW